MSQGNGRDWRYNKFESLQNINGIRMSEGTGYSEHEAT